MPHALSESTRPRREAENGREQTASADQARAANPENGPSRWPLERVLFALAGTMTLLSAALAVLISPWFLLLTAFVGVSQWLYVIVGACPASIVLSRAFGLKSVVYPVSERPVAGRERVPA